MYLIYLKYIFHTILDSWKEEGIFFCRFKYYVQVLHTYIYTLKYKHEKEIYSHIHWDLQPYVLNSTFNLHGISEEEKRKDKGKRGREMWCLKPFYTLYIDSTSSEDRGIIIHHSHKRNSEREHKRVEIYRGKSQN